MDETESITCPICKSKTRIKIQIDRWEDIQVRAAGEDEMVCMIEMDGHTVCCLSAGEWYLVMTKELKACGYIKQ